MRLLAYSLITMALLTFAAGPVSGRLLENWPYERLFKEADLVVIARAESTTDTKDRFKPELWKVQFLGQDTVFAVQSTLKGKLKEGQTVKVLHYRLPEGVLVQNGPSLVSFRKDSVELKGTVNDRTFKASLGRPEYMLFLRARPDGRFEPVSGQVDPALSVRELHPPDGFLSNLERR
jgi:hypothetical protein